MRSPRRTGPPSHPGLAQLDRPARPARGVAAALAAIALLASPRSAAGDPWPSIAIPPGNAASLRAPAPRPPPGDVAARAEHLAAALAHGDAAAAQDFFLPLDAFLAIKDMRGAARYHATLLRWYARDVAAYRAQLPAGGGATFVRFEPSRRCVWMGVGREANRLPYWSCYGSRLFVRAGGREVALRVHVMINWGDRWYVTHLGPIPRR